MTFFELKKRFASVEKKDASSRSTADAGDIDKHIVDGGHSRR